MFRESLGIWISVSEGAVFHLFEVVVRGDDGRKGLVPNRHKNPWRFELQAKTIKNAGCWGQVSNFLGDYFNLQVSSK
jgi:hypothetical protein